MKQWKVLNKHVMPYSYRIYSNFCDNKTEITPWEILQLYIEPSLNKIEYQDFYSDKNFLDKIYNKKNTTDSIIRNIDGIFYDVNYNTIFINSTNDLYNYLDKYDKILIKPSTESDGGLGIRLFKKENGIFKDGIDILTLDFLKKIYNHNWLIQDYFIQSDFMSQFNVSSVNTIRIATYRSVKTNEIKILGAALRIGNKNSIVDNASSGGYFCQVKENGKLGQFVLDFYGRKCEIFNDINFADNDFFIPKYENVLEFSKNIAAMNLNNRLLALDICLDQSDNPKLIEVNCKNFSIQFFEFFHPLFSGYTEEIIECCKMHKKGML